MLLSGRISHAKYFFYLPLMGFIFVFTCAAADQTNSVLVDIQWLMKHQDDTGLKIVDARKTKDFNKGHIKGAINIPVGDTFSSVENTNNIGSIRHIESLFSRAGIANTDLVVIYDGNSYLDAGRVFWVFEVYGHKQVRLLNGGIKSWQVYSNQQLSRDSSIFKKTAYKVTIDTDRLMKVSNVLHAIHDESKLIIDVRSAKEYRGIESKAKRYGHIPNAINIPHTENFIEVNGIKMLKPIEELKAIYGTRAKNKKVLLYCNRGEHSALTYTILRQLGHDAAHYDGSWLEWGNDKALPIKK